MLNNGHSTKDTVWQGFYCDGCNLFQDDFTPTHRAQGQTEWITEDENDVNHMMLE